MTDKENIGSQMDYFQSLEDKAIQFDDEGIYNAYQKDNEGHSLPVKILSVFGGILASFAFVGFLLIAGLYRSDVGLLIFGAISITCAVWLNKEYDKIIIDTVSISSFIIGFILIGFGCGQLDIDDNIICLIFIALASATLKIVQNYLLSFISVLIINGSLLSLINLNNEYDLIHIYVSALALAITYIYLKEAQIISRGKVLSKLYNPVRVGLIFSFLGGLVFLGSKGFLPLSPEYIWLSSIVIIALIVYIIYTLFTILNIRDKRYQAGIYIISISALSLTALSPAISGSMLLIMLSFMVNYKTGFVLGILAFIYFISRFYYDLNYTLLTKSIFLFATGLLFIALYFFTHKKLTAHEKV